MRFLELVQKFHTPKGSQYVSKDSDQSITNGTSRGLMVNFPIEGFIWKLLKPSEIISLPTSPGPGSAHNTVMIMAPCHDFSVDIASSRSYMALISNDRAIMRAAEHFQNHMVCYVCS